MSYNRDNSLKICYFNIDVKYTNDSIRTCDHKSCKDIK